VKFEKDTKHTDGIKANFGDSSDIRIYHNGGGNSNMENHSGDLYFTQYTDDGDIYFRSDDGSGGVTSYFYLDGSSTKTVFAQSTQHADSAKAGFGAASDLEIWHDGSNTYIENEVGDFQIYNKADDKDLILSSDDGSGGTTAYITLDGSGTLINIAQHMDFNDDVRARFGASGDLQIVHTGDTNYIHSTISDRDLHLRVNDGGSNLNAITIDASEVGSVKLPNDNQWLYIGAGNDNYFGHNGTNSIWGNYTGTLQIRNHTSDADIYYQSMTVEVIFTL